MAVFTVDAPRRMRRIQGPVYASRFFMGHEICLKEEAITDFTRVTHRVLRLPYRHTDSDFRDVPMHEFISDCLGTR